MSCVWSVFQFVVDFESDDADFEELQENTTNSIIAKKEQKSVFMNYEFYFMVPKRIASIKISLLAAIHLARYSKKSR